MLPNAPHPNWVILPADAIVAGPSVSYHRSLRDLVRIFLRRKGLFIVTCAVVCLVGGAYLLLTPPLTRTPACASRRA